MFKKFLVLCAMLCCSALWGQSGDVASFEKEAKENANRALELSMYYQGWDEDECFYAVDDDDKKSPISRIYVKNSELSRQIEMRDFNKALYWAEIASKLDIESNGVKENLINLYLLNYESYKENIENLIENFYLEKNILAYIYFLNNDLEQAKELLKYETAFSWKNFYTAKFAPRNLNFVEFFLNNYKVIRDVDFIEDKKDKLPLKGAFYLYMIYSGSLNPNDKNSEYAEKYYKHLEYTKSKVATHYIDAWESLNDSDFASHARLNPSMAQNGFKYMKINFFLTKYKYRGSIFDTYIFIENPFYSEENAKLYLAEINNTYSQCRTYLMYLIKGYAIEEAYKYRAEILKNNKLSADEKSKLLKESDSFLERNAYPFSQLYQIIKK